MLRGTWSGEHFHRPGTFLMCPCCPGAGGGGGGKSDPKAKAQKAVKAVKKSTFKKERKPRYSVVFHRPKTLKHSRDPKYPRRRWATPPHCPHTPCRVAARIAQGAACMHALCMHSAMGPGSGRACKTSCQVATPANVEQTAYLWETA